MEHLFGNYLQRRQAWRSGLGLRLRLLTQWCQSHALLSSVNASRIADIQKRLQSDTLVIGFVGEMGRGKSELINAIFFGAYNDRVLPVGPGHITRCPVEISHAPNGEARLQLLPAEHATNPEGMHDWTDATLPWTAFELKADEVQQIATMVNVITQTITVTAANGTTAITPRWRYARLNLPLPILDHGLHIFDTPGLNAPGAVDDHTLRILPSCDVIALVLSADTGLTASVLTLWNKHLAHHAAAGREIVVIVNKADALGDAMEQGRSLPQQLEQQRTDIAASFGLAPGQIFTVSAQKAVDAKLTRDTALLAQSGLPALEKTIGGMLLADRHAIWQRFLEHAFSHIQLDLEHALAVRALDISKQKAHSNSLAQLPPNTGIQEFNIPTGMKNPQDREDAKIKAVQSILHKQVKKIRAVLQQPVLQISIRQLELSLASSADIGSVHKAYENLQQAIRAQWAPAMAHAEEIALMLASTLPYISVDTGRTPPLPKHPKSDLYEVHIDQAVAGHLQYLGNSRLHQLKQPEFTRQLSKQLHARLIEICHQMATEYDDWCTQLDTHLERIIATRHRAVQQLREQNAQAATRSEQARSELQAQEASVQHLQSILAEHFANLKEAIQDY